MYDGDATEEDDVYAMQYEITLPADYDMRIIRERVATRGHRTDGYDGLGFKAYLMRERGVRGTPVNQYAPFYLWRDSAGMNRFLWGGGGFQGIVGDFGRPAVQHWTGVTEVHGRATEPRGATREVEAVPGGADLTAFVADEISALRSLVDVPGMHRAALAIDPHRWQLVRLTLWEDIPAGAKGDQYELLHLSS